MASAIADDVVVKSDGRAMPGAHAADGRLATVGKKRTRTGCLNCRRKRRKCDETKPTCHGCQARKERCEWGIRVSFRPENAQSMGPEHPSMRHAAACPRSQVFQIINVTKEVIRDYFEETAMDDFDEIKPRAESNTTSLDRQTPAVLEPSFEADVSARHRGTDQRSPETLQHDINPATPLLSDPDTFLSPQYSDSAVEDGIFLPGSQYQELHATLRKRIISTARSSAPSSIDSPDPTGTRPTLHQMGSAETEDDESRRLAHLSAEHEYVLWQNYIGEVAPWLDKFDHNRHFELVLPMIAKTHPHVRYSILALSARQLELKTRQTDNLCSLALYQHAIHLLSPLLSQRTTIELASCVVLCVLEMMSCSPKAWKRHLDGCAALIQSLGLTGGCGGLDQAIFWCFARMDICGGLISSERTLIPMHRWMGGGDLAFDCAMLRGAADGSFDMYANLVVFLCGQVVDLLCSSGKWEQRHRGHDTAMKPAEYVQKWARLFQLLERWYLERPEEMKPLLTIAPPARDGGGPFHTLFYGNGSAVSGNQMYHTAALLMLKHKPSRAPQQQQQQQPASKPHSILWHARQICAISVSNHHHAAWTNSVQPLWIAGQHMSHASEHRAILEVYARIERELGWATKWRADDLQEYWGELDEQP